MKISASFLNARILLLTVGIALLASEPLAAASTAAATAPTPKKAIVKTAKPAPANSKSQSLSRNTAADFQQFWKQFREATLQDNVGAIMLMTRFPFNTRGPNDGDKVLKHAKSSFPTLWKQLLSQEYTTIMANRQPLQIPADAVRRQSLRSYLASVTNIKADNVAGDNWARVGDLEFQKLDGQWMLTMAYTNQ
jgi:hypothetical protein